MKKVIRSVAFVALMGIMLVPALSFADGELASGSIKKTGLTLEHWKNSSRAEQRAFLLGYLMAQKGAFEWQGEKKLPVNRSLAGPWVRGLDGMSFTQICDNLDAYIEQNPNNLDEHVLVVLGRMYVRPNLTPAELKEITIQYNKVRSDR